jgi:hypothetical protein
MLRALYVLQEILHPFLLAICIFLILVPSLKFHELRTEGIHLRIRNLRWFLILPVAIYVIVL